METIKGLAGWVCASLWRVRLLVVVGYLALAVIFSWPLPLHIADQAVLERGDDFYQNIWNLWWMKFSLLTLHQQPYYTDYLHFPTGQPLLYHVVDPLNSVLSIPLQELFGLLTTFNLLRLAHLVFSGVAAYALCRLLGLPRPAAWVGGALYVMCPVAANSFDLGQLDVLSTGWIPLYILCLIRGLGNRALGIPQGKWTWIAGASLALAAAALATWYFFTALVLFTVLYVMWELVTSWRDSSLSLQPLGRAAVVGVGTVALLSPLIIALIGESAKGGDYIVSPLKTIIANSADLFAPFLPMPAHYNDPTINRHGGTAALGWTVIALAVVGVWIRIKDKGKRIKEEGGHFILYPLSFILFWIAVAVLFTLVALGPHLLVWGNDTGFPMPYLLLNKVPFLGTARVPVRFMLLVSLAMSLLAAYGLVALTKSIRSNRGRVTLFAVICLFVTLEFVGIPRTLITPGVHPFFSAIAAKGAEGGHEAVMELPAGERTAPSMLVQTVHQHPILEAYTARKYPYPWFEAAPGVAQLGRSDADAFTRVDIIIPPVGDTALTSLDYYGVRYVAIFATGNVGLAERASDAASALFEPHNIAPIFQDAALTVYKVPPQSRNGPLVGLGSGWYGPESAQDRLWRWTNGNASVQVTNPTESAMPVRVLLKAYTIAEPRTMIVMLDGREIARKEVIAYPSQQISADIDLTPGEHWLQMTSLQPAEIPPGDSRRLSIGFEGVAVERR